MFHFRHHQPISRHQPQHDRLSSGASSTLPRVQHCASVGSNGADIDERHRHFRHHALYGRQLRDSKGHGGDESFLHHPEGKIVKGTGFGVDGGRLSASHPMHRHSSRAINNFHKVHGSKSIQSFVSNAVEAAPQVRRIAGHFQ